MELRSAVAFATITLITFAATTQANEAAKQQATEKLERIGVLDLAKQYAKELY